MNSELTRKLALATNASELTKTEAVQTLWSGYGKIARYEARLISGDLSSIIVKHVQLPEKLAHPRGWNTQRSHLRKLRSYEVECHWYLHYSALCDQGCRVPKSLATLTSEGEYLIALEDLDAAGFPLRLEQPTLEEMAVCLSWLAHFHARFLGEPVYGLWETGTYWHLETRPDELAALTDQPLKDAAGTIDRLLKDVPYQTLVHGDAKLANLCFAKDKRSVAAVDFQYVGRGCGMKDVAYFIGSCLSGNDCQRFENTLLDTYFEALRVAVKKYKKDIDLPALEAAWRPMYAIAWADFTRFVKGWSPGHWKLHDYSEKLTQQVLANIANNKYL